MIWQEPTWGWPLLPEFALIKGPEEAGSHALDGLVCITGLGACGWGHCWRGGLAPHAGPLKSHSKSV